MILTGIKSWKGSLKASMNKLEDFFLESKVPYSKISLLKLFSTHIYFSEISDISDMIADCEVKEY